MYVTATRIAWIMAGLVLFGMHWAFMQFVKTEPQDFERRIAEAEGRVYWDVTEAETAVQHYRAGINRTINAIETHKYDLAIDLFGETSSTYEKWAYEHGGRQIESYKTLYDIYDEEQQHVAEALRAELPYFIDKLKTGQFGKDDESRLFNGLRTVHTTSVKREYDAHRPEIETARAEMAKSWLRVNLNGNLPSRHLRVENAIRRKLILPEGVSIVSGYSFGRQERDNTWQTLDVNLTAYNASYKFDESQSYRGGASLPERVKLSFQMKKGDNVKDSTTWDQLPPIEVMVELPESFSFSFDNNRQTADLSEYQKKYEEELIVKLVQAVSELPEFQVENRSFVSVR